jgi:hypothetical protein
MTSSLNRVIDWVNVSVPFLPLLPVHNTVGVWEC